MPASSSEKRARQRANKLKSSASSVQAPEIIPLPTQTTDPSPTSVRQTCSSLPSTSIDFETFIELADLDDVLRFCNAVASTQGRNLKLLWDRAFEAGLNQGRTEERDLRDEAYLQGKAMGIKQADKKPPNVPKSISTATVLRKEELKSDRNGHMQVMDYTVSPLLLFSLTKSSKPTRNHPSCLTPPIQWSKLSCHPLHPYPLKLNLFRNRLYPPLLSLQHL